MIAKAIGNRSSNKGGGGNDEAVELSSGYAQWNAMFFYLLSESAIAQCSSFKVVRGELRIEDSALSRGSLEGTSKIGFIEHTRFLLKSFLSDGRSTRVETSAADSSELKAS